MLDADEECMKKLVELRAVTVCNNKYIYSEEFEGAVNSIKLNPPGKWRQLQIAKRVAVEIKDILISTASVYNSRRDIENLIVAYICFEKHLTNQGLKVSKEDFPKLAYTLWYLNDHEAEVT